MSTKNNIQDTYVLGLNELNEIAFFKTYNYESEKDEAQKDLEHIRQQGLTWEIGELKNKIQDLIYKYFLKNSFSFNVSFIAINKSSSASFSDLLGN